MPRSPRIAALLVSSASCLLLVALGQLQSAAQSSSAVGERQPQAQIRQVRVLPNPKEVEIEIQTSAHIVPQLQLLANPDRLVVDFPNSVPGDQLRNQAVKRGEVKDVRVSLFAAKPPVTRVVLDLNGPQRYQVFPDGRSVIVKVGAGALAEAHASNPAPAAASKLAVKLAPAISSGVSAAHSPRLGLTNATYPASAQPVQMAAPAPAATPPQPVLEVSFQGGLLSIRSSRSSLSEILSAVRQRTGAEIAIPAGADQEQVAAELGPAPAPEVLSHLLNGSRFNFLILSSPTNPGALDRVILSQRSTLLMPLPPAPQPQARPQQPPPSDEDSEPQVPPQEPPQQPDNANPNPNQPPPPPG